MTSSFSKLWRGLSLIPCAFIACQTTASAQPIPAVLTSADTSNLQALKATIAQAMKTNAVQLGKADLTQSSTISAIPTRFALPPGAPQNHASNFALPTTFYLMMDGTGCYVLKKDSTKKIPLTGVSCRPLSPIN